MPPADGDRGDNYPDAGGYYLGLNPDGKLVFGIATTGGGSFSDVITGDTVLDESEWYRVALSYNPNASPTCHLYVKDADPSHPAVDVPLVSGDACPTGSPTGPATSEGLGIGIAYNAPDEANTNWYGSIVDVRLWSSPSRTCDPRRDRPARRLTRPARPSRPPPPLARLTAHP